MDAKFQFRFDSSSSKIFLAGFQGSGLLARCKGPWWREMRAETPKKKTVDFGIPVLVLQPKLGAGFFTSLKMEQEADFSEPEQVELLKSVLVADPTPALPSTSSTPSPAVDGSLPADGGSLPASDGHKTAMEEKEKKKVGAKAAPSSAQNALNDLRPFLRFADGMKDSDADLPKARSTSVPRASSKPRSRSKSKQQKKERQSSPARRSKTPPRSRSRPVSSPWLRAWPA